MTEFKLFDTPGAEIAQITTDGDTIKPFLNAIDHVVDEARLHVDADGLHVTAVDPANVFMIDTTLEASAFQSYTLEEEGVLGINVGSLKSLVRRARKNSDDELDLALRERELTATVGRGYENHNVVSQGDMDLIDPDAIRQEPTIPNFDHRIDIGVDLAPFTDALSYAVGASEYVKMSVKGVNQHTNALYLGGETDIRRESAAIDGISTDEAGESLYSADYMAPILSGITGVDPERVNIRFSDEYPALFHAVTESMTVDYIVAPRVQS